MRILKFTNKIIRTWYLNFKEKGIKKISYCFVSVMNKMIFVKNNVLFFYDKGMISFNELEMIKWAIAHDINNKYKIVFYTNRPDVAARIFPEKVKIISNEFEALIYQLISKHVFIEQNGYKWVCEENKRQNVIQLWHGVPIKRVGNYNNREVWYKYNDAYKYVLAPSEKGWDIMKECFGYSDEKKIICPYPRCDAFKRSMNEKQIFDLFGHNIEKKLFLWMPTFRSAYYEKTEKADSEFPLINSENIFEFNKFLKEIKVTLIIKTHVLQRQLPLFRENYSNVIFISNNNLYEASTFLYELIGRSDCLISDYSSVIYDYLLLNKPMIFTKDDFESYKKRRGFIKDDFIESLPGTSVQSLEELKEQIQSVLEIDEFKEKRLAMRKEMNQYSDLEFCSRLFQEIGVYDGKEN